MSSATARCPTCFTSSPVPADGGEVVCPSCEHTFTADRPDTPARKNPAVPLARALPVAGKPAPPKGDPPPARRTSRGGDDDRPRTRSRRKYDDDDRPAKRGGGALPVVLIAGGVLALLTVGGVVAVAAVLLTKPGVVTAPVAATPRQDWKVPPEDPTRFNEERKPAEPDPRFPEGPKAEFDPTANPNGLVKRHRAKLTVVASSQWNGWPVSNLTDGQEGTAWFSNTPDNTAVMKYPRVTLTFPEDVEVRRVTILGNRDPQFPTGYTVSAGFVELLDGNGKVASRHDLTPGGPLSDFNLKLDKPAVARAVRFTMTASQNGDCGLGEIQVD